MPELDAILFTESYRPPHLRSDAQNDIIQRPIAFQCTANKKLGNLYNMNGNIFKKESDITHKSG